MTFPIAPAVGAVVSDLNDQITALINVRERLIQLATPIEQDVYIWNFLPVDNKATVKADMQSDLTGVALTMDEINQLIGNLDVLVPNSLTPPVSLDGGAPTE